jgi:polysaccharide biosynthesis transport protein
MEEDAPIPKSRIAFVSAFFTQLDHYKRLIFRYWWIPFLAVLVGVWIPPVMLKHARPSFISEGRMFLSPRISIPGTDIYTEDANFMGTQVALMQSASVRNRVNVQLAHRPELHPSPVEIAVALTPKTSVFNLRAIGEDADYTKAYLQATMDEYINLRRDLLANASTATETSMHLKLDQIADDLKKSHEDVLNFQSNNTVVFLQPQGDNNAADLSQLLTRQLDEAESQLDLLKKSTLEQNLERLSSQPGPVFAPVQPDEVQPQPENAGQTNNPATANQVTVTNGPAANGIAWSKLPANLGEFENPYLQTLLELSLLKGRMDWLHTSGITNEEKAPDLKALKDEIAQDEIKLEVFKRQSQAQMESRQHTLEVRINSLKEKIAATKKEAVEVNRKLSELAALKDIEKRLQTRYETMQADLQTLDLNKGIGQESVSILEHATVAQPVIPSKVKQMAMAGLVGLVLGIGIVVFIDRLDDRPRTFSEAEKLFNKPVLGQFPLMKVKNKKLGLPILQLNDSRYPLVEASHSLRSALLYQDSFERLPKDQPKSIVITSARPNDGKSMVSANFAITLAQTGARVLLVDADLRRGVLHKQFSVGMSPGLAEALARQCPWSSAVVQTSIPNLHLLPCGNSPRNPSNLFAAADKLLKEMEASGNYDYYLFDTTPVLVGDDVLSLAPQVDGLLMVIRAGFTSGRIAQAALDLLRLRGVNVMGLVFNAVNPKTSDYYYYRYKEYYPEPAK